MDTKNTKRKSKPATTPLAREQIMQSMAMDLIEERLQDKTISNALLLQFLKDTSSKSKLELEKLQEENKLLKAKTAALEAERENSVNTREVMEALRRYSGQSEADTPI